jgi:hypothetical protein
MRSSTTTSGSLYRRALSWKNFFKCISSFPVTRLKIILSKNMAFSRTGNVAYFNQLSGTITGRITPAKADGTLLDE